MPISFYFFSVVAIKYFPLLVLEVQMNYTKEKTLPIMSSVYTDVYG